MTTSEQNINQELPPIIPSWVLLAVVGLGILLGIIVGLLQGEFGIVTVASFLVSFIALLAWALMFPEQLLDIIKGRSFAFGGTAVIVTVILIVAASFVYIVIKEQAWRTDLSERDLYSLDEEVHDVLEAMGEDPRIPAVTFIGLYGPTNADDRDRFEVLFNDMANVANGKISYQFVDPSREVRFVEQYSEENATLRIGQVIVAVTDPETGISTENFEVIFARDTAQFELINAMLTLSAVGDFRAYFLGLEGGIDTSASNSSGASQFASDLEDDNWTVEQISPLQISGDNPQIVLNDVAVNAEVLVIAGGSESLDEASMATVQNYAANGGDLVIFGDINTTGGISTAQAENMSSFLWENYGVRLNDDLVLDPDNTVGNPETIIIKTYGTHTIVQGLSSDTDWLVMEFPHSIEIAETLPAGVTVTILASTTDTGYTKTGLDFSQDFTDEELAFVEGDNSGEIVVAVAVENSNTDSRLVLLGSDALLKNDYRQYRDIVSPEVVMSAIVWSSDAQDFANDINRLIPEAPTSDEPILVTDAQLQWMGVTALVFLPFGTLALGLLVWWLRRKSRLAD